MKRTVNINISGRVFIIDEDAYTRLKEYLKKIETYFANQESGTEIFSDIESRIAELFEEKIDIKRSVVHFQMVEEVIAKMGEPEEFSETGSKSKDYKTTTMEASSYKKSIFRDIDNRILGGVCSGLAAYFNTDPVFIRIIFVLLAFLSFGVGVAAYIILWVVVPPALTTAQKLQMKGENVTISNIEKTIKEEYEDMKKNFDNLRESKGYKKGESFFKKMTSRDKSVLIIVAILSGAFLLITNIPLFHNHLYHMTWYDNNFSFFWFPGILPFVFILFIIGLVFKSLFRVLLYVIAFVLLGSLAISAIKWIIGIGTAIIMC